MTLFPNSYYNVDHQNLSFVDDINFGNYLWGIGMHEKILGGLDWCKEKLNEIRAVIGKDGKESRSKVVYMVWDALIFHYFVLNYIPTSGTVLLGIVSPRMLEFDSTPQYKNLIVAQQAFSSVPKEMIVAEAYGLRTPSSDSVEKQEDPVKDSREEK